MTTEEREEWRYKFAGMAMQAIATIPDSDSLKKDVVLAVQYADALLAALEKK